MYDGSCITCDVIGKWAGRPGAGGGRAVVVNMADGEGYGEACGLEGLLRCVFLCEFHPTAGPKITCQVWTCAF